MESHGVPGGIQVTQRAYERLAEGFEFEERGLIDVKGKGSMRTYLLLGRRGGDVDPDTAPTRATYSEVPPRP
jgi:hypothetical protein